MSFGVQNPQAGRPDDGSCCRLAIACFCWSWAHQGQASARAAITTSHALPICWGMRRNDHPREHLHLCLSGDPDPAAACLRPCIMAGRSAGPAPCLSQQASPSEAPAHTGTWAQRLLARTGGGPPAGAAGRPHAAATEQSEGALPPMQRRAHHHIRRLNVGALVIASAKRIILFVQLIDAFSHALLHPSNRLLEEIAQLPFSQRRLNVLVDSTRKKRNQEGKPNHSKCKNNTPCVT
ncbi:hypothetical protein SETIT_9G288300v2 [Setaria italica]|uniref:Uncharacterized protein n=1 Tax=Setaria italica TaxID=4555 RepID=A0A368SLQ0_SETIT|nr:hypothetical protein SETIT_9G288300v2 [Setaria italica]